MSKRKAIHRSLALVLLLAMLAGLFPQTFVSTAKAAGVTQAQVKSALSNLPVLKPVNRQIDLPRAYEGDSFEKVDAMNNAFKAISGRFYIVTESKAADGSYYMLHPWLTGSGESVPSFFPAAKVEVENDSVFGAEPSLAADFEWCGEGVSGSIFPGETDTGRSAITPFYISFKDGRNLKFYNNGNGIRRNDAKNTTVKVYLNYLSGAFMFRYDNTATYSMMLNTSRSNFPYFEIKDATGLAAPYFRLYQILENRVNTEPLYNAIKEMESYVGDGAKFEESSYQAFLDCMDKAVQNYRTYNGVDQAEGTDITALSKELELLADELRSYAMEAKDYDYIDIALEAFDFRADGFMFEALKTFGSPYSLSYLSPDVKDVEDVEGTTDIERPGTFAEGENYDENKDPCYEFFIKGLIKDELVNGRIVYTEAVVKYIALAVWNEVHFVDPASYYPDWNGVFLEFAKNLDRTNPDNLGDYKKTLNKTDTKAEGGVLMWQDVKNAYDLAYYMLHGIWFKAEERTENVLETKTTRAGEEIPLYYNTYIEEFSKLRLLPVGNGFYKFSSQVGFTYNKAKGYIYNDYNTRRVSAPTFNVAANLGYDSDDMFGIAQTGMIRKVASSTDIDADDFYANANYYFGFHASAPFIYRKEDNLKFSFVGDDDVYFFINGKLVCDIGGIHGSPSRHIELEAKTEDGTQTYAESWGLTDGDICSFDMFFVDRHLTGINVTLETNIKMMDATVDTEKFQYNADTGTMLSDDAAVESHSNIGYGFALTNRMELGVTNLSFIDTNLGVSLDQNELKLNNTCTPADLIVTYTTCDDNTGALHDEAPETVDYGQFREKLRTATFDPTTTVNPLKIGSYRIRFTVGEEATQLKDLLSIGLPANTRVEIRGMVRRDIPGGRFTNTLATTCYPLDLNDNTGMAIQGTASCSLDAMSLSDVKVGQPASIVLDYGKPLNFNPTDLTRYLEYNRQNIELKFAGLRLGDDISNGATYTTLPSDVSCTLQKPQAFGKQGSFSRWTQHIRYTLNGMMDQIERCYLLYSVEYSTAPGIIRWYVALELDLIPATMMYYEAEQLVPDWIRYEEQYEDAGEQNPEWIVKTDADISNPEAGTALSAWTNPSTELQDTVISGEGQKQHMSEEFVLFSFDDWQEYDSPVYTDVDYNDIRNWSYQGNRNTNGTIEDGAFGAEFELNTSVYKDYACWFQTTSRYNCLNYHPTENDCFKIRIRFDNIRSTSGDDRIKIGLRYYWDNQKVTSSAEYRSYPVSMFNNKGYVTVEFNLGRDKYLDLARLGKAVTALRLEINNVDDFIDESGTKHEGSFKVEYMYLGPKEYSYLLDSETIFIDFTNSEVAKMHYNLQSWAGGFNPDQTTDNWDSLATYHNNVGINTEKGEFSISQTSAAYTANRSSSWFQLGPDMLENYPLLYSPTNAEVVQVRFKLENMVPLNSLDKFNETTSFDDKNNQLPRFTLQYYYTKNRGGEESTEGDLINNVAYENFYYDAATMDGQYITLTMIPNAAFKGRTKITTFRFGFSRLVSKSATELGKITLDYFYVGDMEHLPGPVTYGYDSSYTDAEVLSDGSSLFALGKGVKVPNSTTNKNFTEINFDFKGTGFDIISRTGAKQGTIRVEVKNKVTGEAVKKLTVNNKGELELNQIPVVSIQGLSYGSYSVTLWVNNKIENSILEVLNRGNEFYFDALRIYDPLDTAAAPEAQAAYGKDLESYPFIKEIRNILLSADEFDDLNDTVVGALFVDTKEKEDLIIPNPSTESGETSEPLYTPGTEINIDNHYALTVQTYNKVGPKNEVYLDPGQAIAFKLEIPKNAVPASLDIGVKTLTGQSAQLVAGIMELTGTIGTLKGKYYKMIRDIDSATAMYYPLETDATSMYEIDGKWYCYVVIYNNPTAASQTGSRSHVLSITDIKATYRTDPGTLPEDSITDPEVMNKKSAAEQTEPIRFLVDEGALLAARALILSMMETPVTPVEQGLRHSLNLSSDIALNYVVPKADLEGYDRVYLTCEVPRYNGNDFLEHCTVTIEPVERDSYYYFTLEGLTAVNMADTIVARLYMEKDGETFASQEDLYSIADYAYSQLSKANIPDSLKTLCADLLRYGAKAQIYKSYRTDFLADADMTDSQKAYLSDMEAVTFGNTDSVLNDLGHAPITWVGKSLNLNSKVTLNFVFDPTAYAGDPSALTLRISYEDISGNMKALTLGDPKLYNEAMDLYVFSADMLLAAELRSVVSARIYAEDTPVSCTLQYSADTYGNNKTGTLLDLCKALFAYSDSAKGYFVR